LPTPLCGDCGIAVATVLQFRNDTWKFACYECEPRPDYWLDLYRIGSAEKALGWLIHLRQKIWFDDVVQGSFLLRLNDLGLVDRDL